MRQSAWQVSVLEQLADLLEASGAPRTEDEDLASMRDEARRKLDDINEVLFPKKNRAAA